MRATARIAARLVASGVIASGVIASGLVAHRVLAPAEVSYPAAAPIPVTAVRQAGVTSRFPSAPLIVDGRVRVFADDRAVKADTPVDTPKVGTPGWSFRRWPETLVGVVAVSATVVTRWSDGRLVALRAGTGEVAWRHDGPPPAAAGTVDTALTRVGTVWAPAGLHTVPNGSVLVTGRTDAQVLDADTGALRHGFPLPPGCAAGGFTTAAGQYVCSASGSLLDAAAARPGSPPPAAPALPPAGIVGPVTALGCGTAASGCAGLRDAAGHGWLLTGPAARAVPALDAPGSTVISGAVVSAPGSVLVATSPLTGAELWRRPVPDGDNVQVVGGGDGVVHLLTGGRDLVTVDAVTGVQRSRFAMRFPTEKRSDWAIGAIHVSGRWLAVERLVPGSTADADRPERYWAELTVLLAAT
jgi:outer membrane protein assembly factor BamB